MCEQHWVFTPTLESIQEECKFPHQRFKAYFIKVIVTQKKQIEEPGHLCNILRSKDLSLGSSCDS